MSAPSASKTLALFALLVVFVIAASAVITPMWNDKPEGVQEHTPLIFDETMTVGEFAKANNLSNQSMKSIFGLQSKSDLDREISGFDIPKAKILEEATKQQALGSEYETKNWLKIPLKFGLWFLFLGGMFYMLRNRKVNAANRKWFYLSATVIFGVVLTSDPSPMGTVKDAIHLYAVEGVFFPPRMIALCVFLLTVFLANKFICSWGCQLGVLQDLIFRLNRNSKDSKAGSLPQIKVPFVISNGIRIAFLIAFTIAAFAWGIELIEPIDPFRVYKPLTWTLVCGGFIIGLLILSLFVYRPWCHFACPFGLVGWLVEKFSLTKIKVDYDTCIACEACAKACPSTVMGAILKQDKTIPDCFSCGTCIGVCPTDSISFGKGRQAPPPDKFTENKSSTE